MNEDFQRHFRIYFKSKHPAYIVNDEGDYYFFHRVTSSPKSGSHSNWEVNPNPDKRRKTPMYIVHAQEKDEKKYFSGKLPYNINLDFIKFDKKSN